MTFGSLFAGAGGIDIGLERAGLECRWQVEIDAKANSVRRRHWPDVKHYEDVRTFKKAEPVDLICGGFPCQDLSVAGNRKGLSGNRSGLWWEMLRIIKKQRPSYVLWENVAGLLSSDGGRDFERVIGSLAECGYYGCCRILDAQHFGVPQRRRRVFGLFASESRVGSGAERCREILAVTEGVQRDYPKGGKAGESVTTQLAPCLRSSGVGTERIGDTRGQDCVVPFTARCLSSKNQRIDAETETFVACTIPASTGGASSGMHPIVPMAYNWNSTSVNPHRLCPTIRAQAGCGSGMPAISFQERGRANGPEIDIGGDLAYALTAPNGGGRSQEKNIATGMAVRRLTPRECERLMSWPDDWTRYGHDGKEIADGPRYRMIGNGVVSNCVEWIGNRLTEVQS